MKGRLRVVPLGGLGEIGMNALALVDGGKAVLIDCGVTFSDAQFGVDVVHPDFSFLDSVRFSGVLVTHGHEDHIGALPYLLSRYDVPVYGPPYALSLVRERLHEHEVLAHARLIETRPGAPYEVGPFGVEHVRVTHSIADATSLVLRTSAGRVIHTGDFKVDDDPPDGQLFDHDRLRALGDEGVALLMSDSTNVESEGSAGSESLVRSALSETIAATSGAVVVGLFASNVHRLRIMGELAARHGRKLVLLGRSVQTHSKVARETGYLDWPSEIVFPAARARELPKNQVLGVATGTQAETNAALAKLARDDHPHFSLSEGDAVVFSSRVIPGNDPEVYALMSAFARRKIVLHTHRTTRGLHVSGHAHRGEQRHMLELTRPRAFIPLHGTRVHLERHAALARECGVSDTMVLENGETAWLDEQGLSRGESVHSGRVRVFAKREISNQVFEARKSMAEAGVVACTLVVDASGHAVGRPILSTRGVVSEEDEAMAERRARDEIATALAELGPPLTDERLEEATRYALRRAYGKLVGRRPVPMVTVVRR